MSPEQLSQKTYRCDCMLRLDFDREAVLAGDYLSVGLDHVVIDLRGFHLGTY